MGDWYPDPKRPGQWRYDPAAPSPGTEPPAVTQIQHTVQPARPSPRPRQAEVEDEKIDNHEMQLIDPREFPLFSQVDSRIIRMIGAPD